MKLGIVLLRLGLAAVLVWSLYFAGEAKAASGLTESASRAAHAAQVWRCADDVY
jgi:hypothetical protein